MMPVRNGPLLWKNSARALRSVCGSVLKVEVRAQARGVSGLSQSLKVSRLLRFELSLPDLEADHAAFFLWSFHDLGVAQDLEAGLVGDEHAGLSFEETVDDDPAVAVFPHAEDLNGASVWEDGKDDGLGVRGESLSPHTDPVRQAVEECARRFELVLFLSRHFEGEVSEVSCVARVRKADVALAEDFFY
jgi:hypothetical protein